MILLHSSNSPAVCSSTAAASVLSASAILLSGRGGRGGKRRRREGRKGKCSTQDRSQMQNGPMVPLFAPAADCPERPGLRRRRWRSASARARPACRGGGVGGGGVAGGGMGGGRAVFCLSQMNSAVGLRRLGPASQQRHISQIYHHGGTAAAAAMVPGGVPTERTSPHANQSNKTLWLCPIHLSDARR